jgi:hypothetical protein
MKMGLQFEIEQFVDDYAPRADAPRSRFITRLRALMNEYALAGIKHGGIPEVGIPHGAALHNGKRKP